MPQGYWSISFLGLQLSAGSVTYIRNIRYSDAANGHKYVVLSVSLQNLRERYEDETYINPFNFTLIDLEGRSYSHVTDMYSLDNYLSHTVIYPGYQAGGQIAFEIPANTAPAQLLYEYNLYYPPVTLELRTEPHR